MLSAISTSSTPATADPVRRALTEASRATGIPFDYLLRTAQRESNLDPTARAPTSTASGLFQFLDQTWLGVVRETGAQHGLAREAEQIERRADGRYAVADPAERQRILDMRFDPATNAVMAGEFTRRNGAELTQALGREPSQGELYLAHFLGASGASRFLTEATRTPDAAAAPQFSDAARANRNLFYARDGRALSFTEVRERLMARHETVVPVTAAQSVTEAALAAGAQARAVPQARLASDGPVFHSLFQVDGRGPVSPVVQALWARGTARPAAAPQPFFPSSSQRLGIIADEAAPAAANALAPAAVPASPALGAISRATGASAVPESAGAVTAPAELGRVEAPPPPRRPRTAAARQQPPGPATPAARAGSPLDLLSFARRGPQ